jgi:hypothetical protein
MIGAVAQLGEHRVCNAGVVGSIPISSTMLQVSGVSRLTVSSDY